MLKLVAKDGSKNFWLVGDSMRIGQSRKNEIPIVGAGIGDVHGCFYIDSNAVSYQSSASEASYLNENKLMGKTLLAIGDTLRIGSYEFILKDSLAKSLKTPPEAFTSSTQQVSNQSDADSTVFRQAEVCPASGWLIQALHPSLKNKRFPIEGTVILGRSKDCDFSFASERLSRQHAQLKILDGNLFFNDLGSSNGVFHNGEKVSQAKLSNGDTIALDKLEFSVIAPKTLASSSSSETEGEDLTVVRAAITPDMIKKAQQVAKNSQKSDASIVSDDIPDLSQRTSHPMLIVSSIFIGLAIILGAVFIF
jgi:pSer/pThr/pTyr-binding forkhead associated (FHA) protein